MRKLAARIRSEWDPKGNALAWRKREQNLNVEAFCATAIVIMCYHGSGLITFDSYVIDLMTPNA